MQVFLFDKGKMDGVMIVSAKFHSDEREIMLKLYEKGYLKRTTC